MQKTQLALAASPGQLWAGQPLYVEPKLSQLGRTHTDTEHLLLQPLYHTQTTETVRVRFDPAIMSHTHTQSEKGGSGKRQNQLIKSISRPSASFLQNPAKWDFSKVL